MSLQAGLSWAMGDAGSHQRAQIHPPGAGKSPSQLITSHTVSQQPPEHAQTSEGKDPPWPRCRAGHWGAADPRPPASTAGTKVPCKPPSPHVGTGGPQSCGDAGTPRF